MSDKVNDSASNKYLKLLVWYSGHYSSSRDISHQILTKSGHWEGHKARRVFYQNKTLFRDCPGLERDSGHLSSIPYHKWWIFDIYIKKSYYLLMNCPMYIVSLIVFCIRLCMFCSGDRRQLCLVSFINEQNIDSCLGLYIAQVWHIQWGISITVHEAACCPSKFSASDFVCLEEDNYAWFHL